MSAALMTRAEEKLTEENAKYWRKLREMEEQACANKRNSGLGCQNYCAYNGTAKCLHPEKAFPRENRY